MELNGCAIGDEGVKDFMDALEDSGCAKRLESLTFEVCKIGEEGVRALADLLCRGALPALERLSLPENFTITDGRCRGPGRRFAECPEDQIKISIP